MNYIIENTNGKIKHRSELISHNLLLTRFNNNKIVYKMFKQSLLIN